MTTTTPARTRPHPEPPSLDHELDELAAAAEETECPRFRARLHEDMVVLALPLADGIVEAQKREIGEMKQLIADLDQ